MLIDFRYLVGHVAIYVWGGGLGYLGVSERRG